MKRTLLLWALMLGCICAALAQPQTKIRIDGREATAAEYDALPKERVKSLSWSREGEVRVLNVTLTPEAATRSEVPEGALVLQPAPASATPEERWNHLRDQLFAPSTLLKNGDRAAAFTAECFDGGTVRSDDLRGKVVLLCFWGTWCRPCLEELAPGKLPAVLEPYLGRDDFVLLAAAQDDRKSLARFFASGQRTPSLAAALYAPRQREGALRVLRQGTCAALGPRRPCGDHRRMHDGQQRVRTGTPAQGAGEAVRMTTGASASYANGPSAAGQAAFFVRKFWHDV